MWETLYTSGVFEHHPPARLGPTAVEVDSFEHESYSKGARPDINIVRGARDGVHNRLLEVKVVCPISSN